MNSKLLMIESPKPPKAYDFGDIGLQGFVFDSGPLGPLGVFYSQMVNLHYYASLGVKRSYVP